MTRSPHRGAAGLLAAAALVVPVLLTAPALAASGGSDGSRAAESASLDHAQPVDGAVELLVSLPEGAKPDLDEVRVRLGGEDVGATAVPAARDGSVKRTAVLAIDTSLSMRGERIAAAEEAARAYLASVPADVRVGVVTFDERVRTLIAPTRDHAAVEAAVEDLPLRRETALYDGVEGAIEATGPARQDAGQRSVLLLSDGEDSTDTSLSDTLDRVEASGVLLDVVALQQGGAGATPLRLLAEQGRGRVLDAGDPGSLAGTFTAEAEALARQVLVTAVVPDGAGTGSKGSADVTVTFPTRGGTLSAAAYVPVVPAADPEAAAAAARAERDRADAAARAEVAAPAPTGGVSQVVVLAAVAAIGLALAGAVLVVGLVRRRPDTASQLRTQLQAYGVFGSTPSTPGSPQRAEGGTLTEQATQVATKALANQAGLESRIAARLEAAGASFKPAEWVLVHACIVLGALTVSLLLGRGNPLLLLLGLVLGAVGPWVYLGLKRDRRLKAFAAALPDTLQLMSGSLSAGLSLVQSVDTIVREGGEPVSGEFKRAVVESRLGVPFEEALAGIATRMQSKDFEWVVMAIKIQREVGGNLAELLLQVAATLREREYVRRHVRALSAEGRLSAWVIGGLPPLFLLYLTLTKPDYTATLYSTPLGWALIGTALVLMSVGVLWLVKAAKVEM